MQRWKETILVPRSIMEIFISENENSTLRRIKNLSIYRGNIQALHSSRAQIKYYCRNYKLLVEGSVSEENNYPLNLLDQVKNKSQTY